jgi:hypothetical protein
MRASGLRDARRLGGRVRSYRTLCAYARSALLQSALAGINLWCNEIAPYDPLRFPVCAFNLGDSQFEMFVPTFVAVLLGD